MTNTLLLPGYRASDDSKSDSWLILRSARFFDGAPDHFGAAKARVIKEVLCSMDSSSASAVSFIYRSSVQDRRFAKAILSMANGEDKAVYTLTDAIISSAHFHGDRVVEFTLAFLHISGGAVSRQMELQHPVRE